MSTLSKTLWLAIFAGILSLIGAWQFGIDIFKLWTVFMFVILVLLMVGAI